MNIFNFLDPAWLAWISVLVAPPIPGGPTQSSNLLVWIKADAMTGYAHGASLSVVTNYGSASNLVQLTAANQATFATNAFAGGKPGIRFVDDFYVITNGFPTQNLRGAEFFAVLKAAADPADPDSGTLFDWNSSTSGNEAYPGGAGANGNLTSYFYSTNETLHGGIPKPVAMTTRQVLSIQVTNDHMVLRQNGQLFYVSDVCRLGMRTSHLSLGRGWTGVSTWAGDIAELLCYSIAMSDSERMTVVNGLGRKYGIATAGDPYIFPPNIAGTPRFWFRASDLDATLTDGASVSNWTDRSANSLNVTQLTAASMPEFKTGIVGGKSVVRFTTAKSLTFQTQQTFQGSSSPFTLMAVMKPNADCVLFGDPANNIQFRARRAGANVLNFFPGSGEITSGTFSHAVSDWQLNIWVRSAAGVTFWQNATPSGLQAQGLGSGFTSIGGGVTGINLNGDVAEVIWYDAAISTNSVYHLYEFYFRKRYQDATGLW